MSEMSSHFVAVCPNCLVSLRVQHAYSGNYVRCKHCEHKFRALAPDLMATPAPKSSPTGRANLGNAERRPHLRGLPDVLGVVERPAGLCRSSRPMQDLRPQVPGREHRRSAQASPVTRVQKGISSTGSTREPESPALGRGARPEAGRAADLDRRTCGPPRRARPGSSTSWPTGRQELARLRSELEVILKQAEEARGERERLSVGTGSGAARPRHPGR